VGGLRVRSLMLRRTAPDDASSRRHCAQQCARPDGLSGCLLGNCGPGYMADQRPQAILKVSLSEWLPQHGYVLVRTLNFAFPSRHESERYALGTESFCDRVYHLSVREQQV